MKIRTKVIALLIAVFAALGAAQLLVQQNILIPGFAELEQRAARADMDRVIDSVTRDLDLLEAMTADWANWEATNRFMLDRIPKFSDTNMSVGAIQGYRANVVAFVDLGGRCVWATAIAPVSGAPITIDVVARGG